jgi:hypothetical protein
MIITCPDGHRSTTSDYCDQCGARIESTRDPVASLVQPAEVLAAVTAVVKGAGAAERCPACDAPRATGDLFCEGCGFDYAGGVPDAPGAPPPAPSRGQWSAVIAADREYFTRVAPEGVAFPTELGPRTFVLENGELRIGRQEAGGDPAVSRLHAVIVPEGDAYVIVDKGSTNGTRINDDRMPIPPNVPAPLAEGDRIYLGAWTTITLHRGET